MDLYEYQGKQLFARYDIPVSNGEAVESVDAAVAAADRIGYPVVVKAQVQVGGITHRSPLIVRLKNIWACCRPRGE